MTVDTAPPTCSCGAPAAEQIHTGTALTPSGPVRHYAWMCPACVRDWAVEEEVTIRG